MYLVRAALLGFRVIYLAFAESVKRIKGVFYGQPAFFKIFAIQIAVRPVSIKLINSASVFKSVTSIYFLNFQ